jgi:hypothetical protein
MLIVTERLVDSSLSHQTDYLLPWYLNYLGGNWSEATQCMVAGSNSYEPNQLAYNNGLNNHWALNNTPWSWGYFKREDLPVQFAMAEGYTSNDMYQVREDFLLGLCRTSLTRDSGRSNYSYQSESRNLGQWHHQCPGQSHKPQWHAGRRLS